MRILFVLLIAFIPAQAFAQPVLTFAPLAVGGLSSWTLTQPYGSPITPYFSALAGIEGSFWGLTDNNNLAFTLGIGYDSRETGGQGRSLGAQYTSNYDVRMNYAEIDVSLCYLWFQAGVVAGIPLKGDFNQNSSTLFYPYSGNFPNTDLNTTFGIFAATNFTIVEWPTSNLILVARLDYEPFDPFSNSYFVVTNAATPTPVSYFPGGAGPIVLARLGLSYKFNVWQAAK